LTSYSELVSDEYLLQQVGEANSVSIFGCPYCANQCIALSKGMSVIGKTSLGGIKYTPYAVTQEANRIKQLLESKGKSANVNVFGFLASNPFCWMTEKGRSKIAKACRNSDAAIALSCYLGVEGIKSALPESFKVIPAMTTVGQITSYLTKEKGKIILDKDKTKVYRFKEIKHTTG
jgi:hypothetical protein